MKKKVSIRRYKVYKDGTKRLISVTTAPNTTKALEKSLSALSSIDSDSSNMQPARTRARVVDAENFCDDYFDEEYK